MAGKVALISGVTGITGQNLAQQLVNSGGWEVYGISRKPANLPGVKSIAVDLQNLDELKKSLSGKQITHAFFASWLKQESEKLNCEVNGKLLQNFLDALSDAPLAHVSLVTGGKNYFGSFEDSGKYPVVTPYREEQARKPGLNFYYTQEDILFAESSKRGFAWSVHRPQTIIGYAIGNAMNMGTTLAAFATLCKETGRPFTFPGSTTLYNGVSDITDARILAKQLEWATQSEAARNQAFNITNGDVIRWNWMWQQLADYFKLPVGEYTGEINPLEVSMKDADSDWDKIIAKYNLKPTKLNELASWWHTDSDLSRTFEPFSDVSKSRKLGFLEYQKSSDSFFELFDRLRAEKIIP